MIKLKSFRHKAAPVFFLIAMPFISMAQSFQNNASHRFDISFTKSASEKPITGRVFLAISRDKSPEPRYEAGSYFKSVKAGITK